MGAVEEVLFFVSVFREFGVPVDFEPGWDTRGNGYTAAYEGGIVHHTGIAGASYSNPGPGTRILRDGRPDLRGPLCQYQGLFNGRIRVIAAHPANHAGAGNGRSMGPLPRTNLFNPRVQGLELDYAGSTPMSPEQYYAAKVFAIAVKRRYGSVERCRLHFETSAEGKWDAGWKPGTPIDGNGLRRDALALEAQEEDNMSAADFWNYELVNPVTGAKARAGDFLRYACADRFGELVWGHQMENANGDTVSMATVMHATDKNVAENGAKIDQLSVGGVDLDELVARLEEKGILTVSRLHAMLNNTALVHKDSTQEGGQ